MQKDKKKHFPSKSNFEIDLKEILFAFFYTSWTRPPAFARVGASSRCAGPTWPIRPHLVLQSANGTTNQSARLWPGFTQTIYPSTSTRLFCLCGLCFSSRGNVRRSTVFWRRSWTIRRRGRRTGSTGNGVSKLSSAHYREYFKRFAHGVY